MDDARVQEKLKTAFADMYVYKNPKQSEQFSALSIPPYLRDWLVMRFGNSDGVVDMDQVQSYVRRRIPQRDDWERLKGRMTNARETIRILANVQVQIDVKTGQGLFKLPDFGFPRRQYEAVIGERLVRSKRDELLATSETWGVMEMEWQRRAIRGSREEGCIVMVDFEPFQPYAVDLDYFKMARREFVIEEWIDLLLMAVDYNPDGFLDKTEKLTMLSRLLPFVEKRLNLIELAPKGTGKSYMFSQLSKHGWLVSGGMMSRARMFHNLQSNTPGLVTRHDFVVLDEISTINFTNADEMRGALKGYMESGEYRVGEHRGIGEAGIVVLGNIDIEYMDANEYMLDELPSEFHESALIDRFHGFIKGWNIPRMQESMKAEGWALNTEYVSEIFHELRQDALYRQYVDEFVQVPARADTRDTEAVRRIATAWLKLLFPHVRRIEPIPEDLFRRYCLEPAINMRKTIRTQMHHMDREYSLEMPQIHCLPSASWPAEE